MPSQYQQYQPAPMQYGQYKGYGFPPQPPNLTKGSVFYPPNPQQPQQFYPGYEEYNNAVPAATAPATNNKYGGFSQNGAPSNAKPQAGNTNAAQVIYF